MAVLDICVKNCGYPFHLQISRKDFLNELVRKFPEKPPLHFSRTQMLILEAIEEWRQTICKTSRYKDDLGYIRDMHRLLSYKGYMFPEVNKDDAAVLNPSDTLKSAQELEQEERDAQSAKLQELIRRGTPADLQEANHLMSIMAGFKENKTNYRAKAAKDLDKTRRKAEILEEMLANVKQGDHISDDDVFSEIVSALKNATPKIQKMIDEEGTSDQEALVKLLGLNDYIHALLEKYNLLKQGNIEQAHQVQIKRVTGHENKTKTDVSSRAAIVESLIDIDDDAVQPTTTSASSAVASSAGQDLLGAFDDLSLGNNANFSFGEGGGAISLGDSTPILRSPAVSSPVPSHQIVQQSTGGSLTDYSALAALSSSARSTPVGDGHQRTDSGSASLLDDWTFSSAAPVSPTPPVLANKKELKILDSSLKIIFEIKRNSQTDIGITAFFSNNSPLQPISDLNFLLATPKSLQLKMNPQSGSTIRPNTPNGVTQSIVVIDPQANPTSKIKLRWKVSYKLGTTILQEDGVIDALPQL
jgi:ADP-ribosylation factor-binding protein GGA